MENVSWEFLKRAKNQFHFSLLFLCYTFFLLVPEVATGCGIRSVRAPTPVGEALFTRRLAFAKPTQKKRYQNHRIHRENLLMPAGNE